MSEAPDDGRHEQRSTSQRQQHRAVQQVDLLVEACDDDTRQCREEGGQQDGDEDIRRLCCSELGAIYHYRNRYQRQSAGVQHQEHDHRVRGRILLRVQLLQLFHRLQAQRRCGIVQAQHVGSDVHEDGARHRVTLGDIREQFHEDGAQQSCQHVDDTALLADLHDTEPERQHTRQAQRYLKGRLRRRERRIHHSREHLEVSQKHQFHQRNHECDDEKCNPNVI